MDLNQTVIYNEHIVMQHLEQKGVPAYKIISECDLFDIPTVLDFFNIVNNYLNMTNKLKQ